MVDLPDGLHFGLSDKAYFAIPALSASGIRDLLVSPLTYWAEHLDPEREDESTKAQDFGRAFHCRLLEPGAFPERYAAIPEKPEDAADTADELKALCEKHGLPKAGTKIEIARRLRDFDPALAPKLWPLVMEDFMATVGKRDVLKADEAAKIERTARLIEAHDAAAKACTGGHAEVTILWTDAGMRMKIRADYLKAQAIVDFKSFANMMERPIVQAIARVVADRKHHIGAVHYVAGVEAAKAMVARHGRAAVHVHSGDGPTDDWLSAFALPPEHRFVFVFVEKARVPNVRLREFRHHQGRNGDGEETLAWQSASAARDVAIKVYDDHMGNFGPDRPWVQPEPLLAFRDEDFPIWMME